MPPYWGVIYGRASEARPVPPGVRSTGSRPRGHNGFCVGNGIGIGIGVGIGIGAVCTWSASSPMYLVCTIPVTDPVSDSRLRSLIPFPLPTQTPDPVADSDPDPDPVSDPGPVPDPDPDTELPATLHCC